jgi:hypothetical protein
MSDLPVSWAKETDLGELLTKAKAVADRQYARQYEARRMRAEIAVFLYLGSTRVGLSGGEAPLDYELESVPFYNLIQTAIEWFTSTMVRNPIRPFILTQKGDSKQQLKAQAGMKMTEGTMRSEGVYGETGMLRCQDGFMFEGGGIKWACHMQDARVEGSRVRPWEFFYPERASRLGKPPEATHIQTIERASLAGMFDENEDAEIYDAIMSADAEIMDPRDTLYGETSDMLKVYEMWHFPTSRPDMKEDATYGIGDDAPGHDGRRVLFLKNKILVSEPYPYEREPVGWFKPWRDPVGMWSRPIPEALASAQVELMDIGEKIQSIMRRHAVPHLLLWENAKINTREWTNDDAAIMRTRVPPAQAAHYLVPSAVPSELFQREQQIIEWAQKQIGVTDMALSGEKPPGIDHQPGMEHLAEETMNRHTKPFQAWERAHTDDARIILDQNRFLARHKPDMKVQFQGAKDLEEISWKDFDLDRDRFVVTVQPTSLFAQTPTAKFRQIEKMAQTFPQLAPLLLKELNEYPDAADMIGDQEAEQDNINKKLDGVIEGKPDEDTMPHPYIDAPLAKYLCKKRINRVEADGDGEALNRLSQWWNLVDEIEQQKAAQAAQLQAVAAGATAGVVPGAPPPPPGPPALPPQAAPPMA